MQKLLHFLSSLRWRAASAFAELPARLKDQLGMLNPQDTGREMLTRKIEMGAIASVTCSLGINVTKNDNHALARRLTRQCAEAGFTKAMTWISQLESNGLGGDYDPDASAQWDRRAAEAGDHASAGFAGTGCFSSHSVSSQ